MQVKINGASQVMNILRDGGIQTTHSIGRLKTYSENLTGYVKKHYPEFCDNKLLEKLAKIEGKEINKTSKESVAIA